MSDALPTRCGRWLTAQHLCLMFTMLVFFVTAASIGIYVSKTNELSPSHGDDDLNGTTTQHNGASGELMWFMQLSDVHISKYAPDRTAALRTFIQRTIKANVKPSFVLVTGDLTDAKGEATIGVRGFQQEVEWQDYSKVLNETGMLDDPDFWLDIRGNHDAFNVPHYTSSANHYRVYGAQKHRFAPDGSTRVYRYDWAFPSGNTVRIVAMDQVPDIGLATMTNVLSHVDTSAVDAVETELNAPHTGTEMTTFIAGHYPMSSMIAAKASLGARLTAIASRANMSAYLCGHFHLRDLYHTRRDNTLELELADYKAKRAFRIVGVDNGVFSFTDHLGDDPWPLIHVLSPKDHRFLVGADNLKSMRRASHIRLLLWSEFPVTSAIVEIDGQYVCDATTVAPPLYTCQHSMAAYAHGEHVMTIRVVDSQHNKVVKHTFALDGSTRNIGGGISNYFGTIHLPQLAMGLFVTLYTIGLLFVVWIPKLYIWYLSSGPEKDLAYFNFQISTHLTIQDLGYRYGDEHLPPSWKGLFTWQWRVHLWSYGHIAWRYWIGLNIAWIWLIVLPIMIGPLSDSKWGVMFVWGVSIDGSLHRYSELYNVGIVLILFKLLPFSAYLARTVIAQHETIAVASNLRCKHRLFGMIYGWPILLLYFLFAVLIWVLTVVNYGFANLILFPPALWLDIFVAYCVLRSIRAWLRGGWLPGELVATDVNPFPQYGEMTPSQYRKLVRSSSSHSDSFLEDETPSSSTPSSSTYYVTTGSSSTPYSLSAVTSSSTQQSSQVSGSSSNPTSSQYQSSSAQGSSNTSSGSTPSSSSPQSSSVPANASLDV